MANIKENFNAKEYKFPTVSGEFIGVFKHRKLLENKPCLMCYFISADNKNEKIVLTVWEKNGRYTPKETECCFLDDVVENTKWRVKYSVKETSLGKKITSFDSAIMVNNSKENERYFTCNFFILLVKRAYPRTLIANLKITKLALSEDKIFICVDQTQQTSYSISKDLGGNWSVFREKGKEKATIMTIDKVTFDIISKEFI